MGCPVRSLKQFECDLNHYNKNWAIIILANPNSESRATEYVLRNFHIMDRISDDVNFYLPGYCLSWNRSEFIQPSDWMNRELNEVHQDFHSFVDNGRLDSLLELEEINNGYRRVIDSPRLGPIFFSDADYADFVMEFTSKKRGYFYSGSCELILLPLRNGNADYASAKVYDLDAIIQCPSGSSIDSFLYHLFEIIRYGDNDRGYFGIMTRILGRSTIIKETDELYARSITPKFVEEKYEIIIQQVVLDIERRVRWSLMEEFYFISYSTKNTMLAEHLKLEMQDRNKNVWIAPDGIPQGREYSLVIPTTLRLAKTFVLLLTPDSAKSHWVKRELDIAINNGPATKVKVVLAEGYTIDEIRKDNELFFYLNKVQIRYQYTDLIKDPHLLTRFLEE